MWRPAVLCGRLGQVVVQKQIHPSMIRSATTSTTIQAKEEKRVKLQASEQRLPRETDVVVVGGGVVGCSCLYHLSKLGVTNTVLLEAHQLTAGTTWHTAGLFHRMARSETDFQIRNITRQLLCRLEEETGINPGWIQNGSILVSSTKNRTDLQNDDFRRWVTFMKVLGHECYLIDPSQAKDIYPMLETSDVQCAIYSPTDGQMDPAGLCQGLTRWAKMAGARVVEDCPVTDIRTSETLLGGTRVTEVHTPHGVIKTNCMINATGSWANHITSKIGVTVPLQSFKHGYVMSEGLDGVRGMPNVRDYGASGYIKVQGESLVVGAFEPNPEPINEINPHFPFGQYEMNWDVFGPMYEAISKRVPALVNAGIKSTILGPESFTPDNRPIIGEDPNVQGFFHCCGFSSHGMQLSGGIGDQIAKWIVQGKPELDLFQYDIRRIHPTLTNNKEWVLSRAQECLSKNYSIHFPHDDPLAGRGQRLSPLHQELEEAGCIFQERNGWERPGWFNSTPAPVLSYDWYGAYDHTPLHTEYPYYTLLSQDYTFDFPPHHHVIQKECEACRERAAIFDMTSFGKYYLTGPDAQKAANWIFSADMTRPLGCTVYTCMLNESGGVEADLTVSMCEGGDGAAYNPAFEGRGFYITTGGATGLYCKTHILREARKNGWQVTVLDHTEDLALLSVQGPHSRDILQQLTKDDLGDLSFPFSSHKVISLAGCSLRALRLSFVGELGWELHVPWDSALAVYHTIMATGQQWGIADAGFRAMNSLSSEKGYRHWHSDVRSDDTPLEANLAFTCKMKNQTDFLGRSALEHQQSQGITKRLVTLTLDDGTRPLWGQEAILRDNQMVGYVRHAEYAFTLGCAIAYGYVHHPEGNSVTKEFLSSGSWQIEAMGERLHASLHLCPPFDPKNMRVHGIYEAMDK